MGGLFEEVANLLRLAFVQTLLGSLKRRLACYVEEGAQGARRVVLHLCLLVFVITLIGAGLVLVPLALLLFMPWGPHTKAIVGLVIGLAYLLVPLAALGFLLSEKRWMRLTGADEVIRKLND